MPTTLFRPRRRAGQRGFTFIEMLTVMVVLGLLAAIALFKYWDLRNAARAAEAAGDFRTVMVGSYSYYADHSDWPPSSGPGTPPPALAPYLPSGFSFSKPQYSLQYDNLGLGGGAYLVGVTLSTGDANLMAKLVRTLGTTTPYFSAGGTLTYIIVGPDGT